MRRFRIAVLGLLAVSGWAAAAEPPHPCAPVVEPAARLACYDKAFPPPPQVREAAAKAAVDAFGRAEAAQARSYTGDAGPADPQSVDARVTRVDYAAGRRSVQLDNGQTWTLAESNSAGPLKPGDAVSVRRGLMGSYLLRTPAGVSLRVRRTR